MPSKGRGLRQRLGLDAAPEPAAARSDLGKVLATHYSTGRLSADEIAQTASAGISGNADPQSDLKRLASAFSGSKRKRETSEGPKPETRNSARGVSRALRRFSVLPALYYFLCPLWDPHQNCQVVEKVSMLLLTDLVDLIPAGLESEYCSYTDAQSGFHADCLSWCDRVSVDPSAHQYVAFGLWGDAAPYTNKDSLYLLAGSVLSGEHRDRWWLSAIAKRRICNCGCKGRHTFERLFEVLVWRYKCLFRGKHPSATHDNKPFEFGSARRKKAGRDLRVRGCLLRKQGDWS